MHVTDVGSTWECVHICGNEAENSLVSNQCCHSWNFTEQEEKISPCMGGNGSSGPYLITAGRERGRRREWECRYVQECTHMCVSACENRQGMKQTHQIAGFL